MEVEKIQMSLWNKIQKASLSGDMAEFTNASVRFCRWLSDIMSKMKNEENIVPKDWFRKVDGLLNSIQSQVIMISKDERCFDVLGILLSVQLDLYYLHILMKKKIFLKNPGPKVLYYLQSSSKALLNTLLQMDYLKEGIQYFDNLVGHLSAISPSAYNSVEIQLKLIILARIIHKNNFSSLRRLIEKLEPSADLIQWIEGCEETKHLVEAFRAGSSKSFPLFLVQSLGEEDIDTILDNLSEGTEDIESTNMEFDDEITEDKSKENGESMERKLRERNPKRKNKEESKKDDATDVDKKKSRDSNELKTDVSNKASRSPAEVSKNSKTIEMKKARKPNKGNVIDAFLEKSNVAEDIVLEEEKETQIAATSEEKEDEIAKNEEERIVRESSPIRDEKAGSEEALNISTVSVSVEHCVEELLVGVVQKPESPEKTSPVRKRPLQISETPSPSRKSPRTSVAKTDSCCKEQTPNKQSADSVLDPVVVVIEPLNEEADVKGGHFLRKREPTPLKRAAQVTTPKPNKKTQLLKNKLSATEPKPKPSKRAVPIKEEEESTPPLRMRLRSRKSTVPM